VSRYGRIPWGRDTEFGAAAKLMVQRREDLFPWVDDKSRLVAADKWLTSNTTFEMGGLHFELRHVGRLMRRMIW